MSWKATAWAIKQTTGSTARKALLLALANYADKIGQCWPSQERLAADTEQSIDSVQRHSNALEEMKLIVRTINPKRRGQYASYRYQLAMTDCPAVGSAGSSPSAKKRFGHAAKASPAGPQALRHKPYIEPSKEPLELNDCHRETEMRFSSFQEKYEPLEMVQNRIAKRIGDDGWLILGDMNGHQRELLSKLERQRKLDDKTLSDAVLAVRLAARR